MATDLQLHPKFAPLFDPKWSFIVLRGGRNSMKSWAAAQAALLRGTQEVHRILCCRELQNSLAESMHHLLSQQIDRLGLGGFYKVQRDCIYAPNRSEFLYLGLRNDPQKVKSTEGITLGIVEEAQSVSQESIETLLPTVMRNKGAQVWFIYNPRYEDDPIHLFCQDPPPGTCIIDVSYEDAMEMGCFEERQRELMEHDKRVNPLMYEHIWLGKIVPNLTMALFKWEALNSGRVQPGRQPDLTRVLIGVDPAVTANKKSDETGIVVAGSSRGVPRHHYVLGDLSGRYHPDAWAKVVMDAYDTFHADAVVGEVNQGGDLVRANLENYCRASGRVMPRFLTVRASRGKVLRAEPVAALYEQGLVHHVGGFADLERQMLHFDPSDIQKKSPDRVDALVHVLTELSGGKAPMSISKGAAQAFTGGLKSALAGLHMRR